jgi:hypothetical protein
MIQHTIQFPHPDRQTGRPDEYGTSFSQRSIFDPSSTPDLFSVLSSRMVRALHTSIHRTRFDQPLVRGCPHSRRTAEAIHTNDRILDIPTIDAAYGGVERVCLDAQVIEDFAYQ